MYDLHVPKEAYEKQIQQLKSQANAIEDNKDMVMIWNSCLSLTSYSWPVNYIRGACPINRDGFENENHNVFIK